VATTKRPAHMKHRSIELTGDPQRAPARAMLRAMGLTSDDLDKPFVAIANLASDVTPCNVHLDRFAESAKEGVRSADGVPFKFGTITVSDGISMGTEGMKTSLVSREVIADSIETVTFGESMDGLIVVAACDKNMPGAMMAIARLNVPSLFFYGGAILPGNFRGKDINIQDMFEACGAYSRGNLTFEDLIAMERVACPGEGACSGMFTANTMSSAIEAMGMSIPGAASIPAVDPRNEDMALSAGQVVYNMLDKGINPRDIMTREAFENAMVITMALGGSTNAVLHLIAMAKSVDVPLTIDDFQTVSDRVPFLADLKPSGQYVMEDLHNVGGTPAVLRYLLAHGALHGDCLTVTGKTLAENLADLPDLAEGQDVIRPWDAPIKKTGHITILRGSLAPEGSVAKITGKEGFHFKGPAKVFDCEEDMLAAMERGEITKGQVIVIRYEGPKGGPGMPEMLSPTSMIMGAGLGQDVALITDGRFSGGSHGFIIGHITPEAQEGGPIALVRDGDVIAIDAEKRFIDLEVSEAEMAKRRAKWNAPEFKAKRGTLYKYIKNVKSASEGCVTDA